MSPGMPEVMGDENRIGLTGEARAAFNSDQIKPKLIQYLSPAAHMANLLTEDEARHNCQQHCQAAKLTRQKVMHVRTG
jgi:hypothetical protein